MLTALACYTALVFLVAHMGDKTLGKLTERQIIQVVPKILLWGWAIPLKIAILLPIEYVREEVLPVIGQRKVLLLKGDK